ncbi:LytR/AlgR family response regulator transcription factor [Flavobacteriaceae bacterium M23B6Z8]
MKRVLIIDDEKDARELLKQYIHAFPEFEVIGEAEDGHQAVKIINDMLPDAIFLDIQMPGLDGFEVLTRLNEIPDVIFSTAYDQYAIKAFEVHAIDYLLKPYGKKRFETALTRIAQNQSVMIPLTESLLQREQEFPSKIILFKGSRRLMIKVSDIIYIEAYGDYSKVFLKEQELLATSGISELEKKLNPHDFLRIHRSHIVNKNEIKEIEKSGRYFYTLLSNETRKKISESYLSEVKKLML